MKRLPIAILALACAFTACKKEEDAAPSRDTLLTARNWRLIAHVSSTTTGGKTTTYDEFADYDACEKDNFTKFSPNKTLVADQGAIKCDPDTDQQSNGTWDFNSDQTKLLLDSPDLGGLIIPFELLELNSTMMKLRITQTYGTAPNTVVDTETYTFNAF
ncbi:hypothetical protein [Hymenobacter cellulosivorans]|uniref:Lipocalin-like domain-containing protein n=1 Tax=Hymenobacter cellulosivorans TaxID=2932249 RepID=A0ABY4FEK8_9BACT|nr:hypothetical protein [Hymenobacter cellulosivorans]UOQ54407.1 hypothetical protein MUN80_06510 [Hymenobacter cellulosivorans]